MVLSLRKKVNIKVRQPLQKILVPVLDDHFRNQLEKVEDIILAEVNVKELEYVGDTSGVIKKKIKPDFKKLGPKLGKKMKLLAQQVGNLSQEDIVQFEKSGQREFDLDGEKHVISIDEVEVSSEDIPGWLVANMGELTVALDVHVTETLEDEGIARELVNKIQRLRKDKALNVTDRIKLKVAGNDKIKRSATHFKHYICSEVLADQLEIVENLDVGEIIDINDLPTKIFLEKT
jgi:isoleucyl-tRNA synthetase